MEQYKRYKKLLSFDEYFGSWDKETVDSLNDDTKEQIYIRYKIKCLVFQRDNFTCQNEDCLKTGSPITLHHTKFQKNNGKDSVKNCVTICKSCHNQYHRGKKPLTYFGDTYCLHRDKKIDWKKVKAEGKEIRKSHPELKNIKLHWKVLMILMWFLEKHYKELDYDRVKASLA